MKESLKNIIEYDLGVDYFTQYIDTIKNISAGEIKDLAQQYFNLDSLYELKIGK